MADALTKLVASNVMERRRQVHLALAAVVSALAAMAMMLYRFPPEVYGFYPACPFFEAMGLLCPGCGATRALAALVHGHLGEAMRWNGLVVLLLPVLLGYAVVGYRRIAEGKAWPRVPGRAVMMLLGIALGFGVLRNVL